MILMKKTKAIGTFVPLTALRTNTAPGETGTFASGLALLDWLKKTGQTAWQMLPLPETHLEPGSATVHVPSPYKGYGVGIDPKFLSKYSMIQHLTSEDLHAFQELHRDWIDDYTLFCALRDHFGTDDWTQWPEGLRARENSTLEGWTEKLSASCHQNLTAQWKLHDQYSQIRVKAKQLGISLVGDLPFYLPLKSPFVWIHQRLFEIDDSGRLPRVSGIPDSPLAHFGRQVWGHPLYRWNQPNLIDKILNLWKIRLRYFSTLFDIVRIDHARGFYLYGSVDLKDSDRDASLIGPGTTVLSSLVSFARSIGLDVFVEDSGDRTTDLRQDLVRLGVSGMKIFRFSLTTKGEERYFPQYGNIEAYPQHCVAVTTTHDTETLLGYLATLSTQQKQKLARGAKVMFSSDDRTLALHLRHALIDSPAETVLIPIQDWLLSTERINVPGTEKEIGDANWRYVLTTPVEDLPINNVMG